MKIEGILKADIVVAGGGPSGIMAAKAAASTDKRIMLLERNGFLGGCATMSLVVPLMTFHAGERQIIKGYAEELIERIKAEGGSTGHIMDPLGVGPTVTPVDPEVYKYVAQEFLLESGVDIKFHSEVIDLEVIENGIKSLLVKTRSGIYKIEADYFIDATGDGDIAYLSGNPMEVGRISDGKCQPMSMMFRVGNVNIERVIEYADLHPEEFVIHPDVKSLRQVERIAVSGFFSKIKEAAAKGEFNINRDRILFFELTRRGEVAVNMSRVIDRISTRDFDLSDATIKGRRQVFEIMRFLKKYIPGFEESILLETGSQIGVRETRRLKGKYVLTEYDIIEGRLFEDTIALGSWPIDIHDPEGKNLEIRGMKRGDYYGIPYRCLIPQNTENLIVTGRAISATHEAFASTRVSPICMALGQAAGMAALIANEQGVKIMDVPFDLLRERLKKSGQVME